MNIRYFTAIVLAVMVFYGVSVNAGEVNIIPQEIKDKWNLYGKGVVRVEHGMLYIGEDKGSNGVVVVSPEKYGKRVTMKFEVMPLNTTCVIEVLMSARDIGTEGELRVPYKYNGGLAYWKNKVECYVFEFNNIVHSGVPNLMKYPSKEELGRAKNNVFVMGKFNEIEVGKWRDNFWLSINGVRLFKVDDDDEFEDGHIALRIRGLANEHAACLIKNITIEDK